MLWPGSDESSSITALDIFGVSMKQIWRQLIVRLRLEAPYVMLARMAILVTQPGHVQLWSSP